MITGTKPCGCITRDTGDILCPEHIKEAKGAVKPIPITALINISPEADPAVIKLFEDAQQSKKWAESRVIKCNDDLKPATADLAVMAKIKKQLMAKKVEYTTPLRDNLKHIVEVFNGLLEPLEEANQITRKKVTDYIFEQNRKKAEAEALEARKLALAREEAELNNGEFTVPLNTVVIPEAAPTKVHTGMGSTGMRKLKKWEIENFADVPDEYKMIDAAKVGKLVRAGIDHIPGIRIYEEETLTVTTRKGE